jgi:hypothetical protein
MIQTLGFRRCIRKKADVGCGAHLTVYRTRSVKADHVGDDSYKGGHTRQGVNL